MASDDSRRPIFRQMLAREAGTGADAPTIAAASRGLCEHFARQLTPLVGDAGVIAIYTRSLHLVQREFPELAPVPASDQADGPLVRMQLSLQHQQPALASEAAVALLTTVSELLAWFIGESLTIRLLREAWPGDFVGATVEETTS